VIAWVTGAQRLTDPLVAAALADAGAADVVELHLGVAPPLVPVAVGVAGPVRVVVGAAAALLLAANVDDLDPRVWPGVLERLLAAGANDAWLTPIAMKKGRPAHTVTALAEGAAVSVVRRVLLTETSSIGLREAAVVKTPLERSEAEVGIGGHPVRVKVARLDGAVVNVMPEWADVAAAAAALGRPAKAVLAAAHAAALPLWES